MLINSESIFKKGDIITIKNILGEEIMCKFVEEDSNHYTITDAWALGMSQQGMSCMPPVVSGEMSGEVRFQKIHAMWVLPAAEQFIPAYTQHITGIEIVPAGTKIIT